MLIQHICRAKQCNGLLLAVERGADLCQLQRYMQYLHVGLPWTVWWATQQQAVNRVGSKRLLLPVCVCGHR